MRVWHGTTTRLRATPYVVVGDVFLYRDHLGADRQLLLLAVAGHVGVAAQWTVVSKAVGQRHDVSSARAMLACTPAAIPRLVLLVRACESVPFHAPAPSAAVVHVPSWMRQAGTAVATAMSVRLTAIRREELLVAQGSSVLPSAGWSLSSARSRHTVLLMSQNWHSGPLDTRLGSSAARSGGARSVWPWARGYPACHSSPMGQGQCAISLPAGLARQRCGDQVRVSTLQMGSIARAITDDAAEGFIKAVRRSNGTVPRATVAGPSGHRSAAAPINRRSVRPQDGPCGAGDAGISIPRYGQPASCLECSPGARRRGLPGAC